MRDSALRGSPWLPVVISTTCSGEYWFSSSTLISVPSGMCI